MKVKVNEKNFNQHNQLLQQGCLYAVGITRRGNIAAEINIKKGNMRLALVYDVKTKTIVHSCPAVKDGKSCWHLALITDIFSFAYQCPLQVPFEQKVDLRHVTAGAVAVDITPEYMEYKGLSQKDGHFAIFRYQPTEIYQPYDFSSLRLIEGPKPINKWKQVVMKFAASVSAIID